MVTAALLSFSLSALPGVFVSSSVEACSSESFGRALRLVRPDLAIGFDRAPDGEAVQVSVSAKDKHILLTVSGHGRSINREFSDPHECEAACRTAALIIDRELEDLHFGEAAPTIETLAPPPRPLSFVAALGAGGTQTMFAAAVAAAITLRLRWNLALFTLTGQLPFSTSTPFPGGGTYQVNGGNLELGGGLSPRLGPGHLDAMALVGLAWTNLAILNSNLPVAPGSLGTNPYLGLAVGYSLELPDDFFLAAQLEEQFALGRTAFTIQGDPEASVTTRQWTFQGWFFVGWRLF